jgi:hypothetical protein
MPNFIKLFTIICIVIVGKIVIYVEYLAPDTQYNDMQHNDIQHNDIQHNDIQHIDIQHNEIQHYNEKMQHSS